MFLAISTVGLGWGSLRPQRFPAWWIWHPSKRAAPPCRCEHRQSHRQVLVPLLAS